MLRGQENFEKKHVYLIPGQGGDARLFKKLNLNNVDTTIINYIIPEKNETLPNYAKRLSIQIDTTRPFYIIGVSFGGMCAVEMAKFLHPIKVIIISSAATQEEIPFRYKFQRIIPINKLFGGKFLKFMTNIVRPIFEPDSKTEQETFKAMIHDKDPKFMKRSVNCIIHWKNKDVPNNIIRIHGDKDHTLPFRKIKKPIRVRGGSHMMILTKADEMNRIINEEISK